MPPLQARGHCLGNGDSLGDGERLAHFVFVMLGHQGVAVDDAGSPAMPFMPAWCYSATGLTPPRFTSLSAARKSYTRLRVGFFLAGPGDTFMTA